MAFKEVETGSKAHILHQQLVARRTTAKNDDWALAGMLYTLRRYDLWRFAVGGYESWEDYLKQPEINISRAKADKLVRIYEYFLVTGTWTIEELKDIPWYALDYVSKKGPNVKNPLELLEASKHLTQKDFKEHYFDVEDGGDRTYTFVLMRKCDQTGNLEKVHEIDSNTIKQALNL